MGVYMVTPGEMSGGSPWSRRAVMATSGASALLGLVVLTGWYTHSPTLVQVLPAYVPMQANTALGLLLGGVGLIGLELGWTRLALACGTLAGAIGLATLIEYLFGVNLGIDQLLLEHYITVETSHPGRMGPDTALCFALTGSCLLLGSLSRVRWRTQILSGAGILVFTLGAVAFIGYLTGALAFYGWGVMTRMAVHTAMGFVFLGGAIQVLAWRRERMAGKRTADEKTLKMEVAVLAITIMTVVAFVVTLNGLQQLRQVSFQQKQSDMSMLATSWAELISSMAQANLEAVREGRLGDAELATLAQVEAAHAEIRWIRETSEILLGRSREDRIEFLAALQPSTHKVPLSVPMASQLAEPMRRALGGNSGTVVAPDYRNETVLAAYTPVGEFDWGLVAKVDMAEISLPFERVSRVVLLITSFFILLGGLGLVLVQRVQQRQSDQLLAMVQERTRELQQAQNDLVNQGKLAVLGKMSGSVGHELRNPLGVISNAVYYLKTVLTDPDEQIRDYLEIISSEVGRAGTIISDLLSFARLKSPEPEEVAVADLLDRALELEPAMVTPGIRITRRIAPGLAPAYVDPGQMERVLVNLLANACQAMPEGGLITLEAQEEESGVRISLTDTGCGISGKNIDQIFQPLFTTRVQGIGFGLSIVKTLVEHNGGSIQVESREGAGTTFTITLPTRGQAS